MAQCPVCQAEYTEGLIKNCPNCHWDLNPYPLIFQLPEAFVEREKAKLAWAKQMWTQYLEEVEKRSQSQLENLLHQPTFQETTQTEQAEQQHETTLPTTIQPQKLQNFLDYDYLSGVRNLLPNWHSRIKLCLLDIARNHEKPDKDKFEELISYLEQYSSSTWEWEKIIDQSTKNNANITGAVYRALLTILGNITISEWLEMPEKGNSPKNQITAIKIQTYLLEISSIRTNNNIYKQLIKRVNLGIIEILLKCQSKIENSTYQNIEWLLNESNSVWTEQFHNYVNNLVVCLVNQDKSAEDQFYQQLVTKLAEREKYQQQFGHYRVLPQYRKLAELFALLGHYSLSAFFYQISYGRVPSDIYDKDDMKIIFTHRDEISSGLTNNTKNRFKFF